MSKSRKSQRAHMLPFHSGSCTVHSCWCSCTSLHSWKCGSVPERHYHFSRNIMWAFTRPILATIKDSTIWNSILKSWQQQDQHHFVTGKGNQLKSHSQLYSLFFFQMVSCVNLCYYVNLSSQVIQYQEQSNLATPLLVKSKWTNGFVRAHDLWLYLLGFGHQMAFPSGRRYLRQSAIPQGFDDLFIQDGMALLHTITNLPPTCYEVCIQILDQTAISIDSYHPGSIKAQERLRRSSPEIILAGSTLRNSYVSDALWSGKQAASRLDRTNMAVLIVEGRIHQFVKADS